MSQLAAGSVFPSLSLRAVTGAEIHLPPEEDAVVHIQFRRFAGCPVCNTHLRSFVRRIAELEAKRIREVVFFHSSAAELLKYANDFPFALIADPAKEHYRRFGVETSIKALLHPRTWFAGLRGLFLGVPGLRVENGPLGLPADILIDSAGRVLAVKYGTHAHDQWSVDEVIARVLSGRSDTAADRPAAEAV